MAVALRSSFDLVYLPDHGFVGEDGALRVLIHVNRQTRRIDISHNLLGSDGLAVFLRGLTTIRSRYSTPESIWGIRELNLATNGLDDSDLAAVLAYAKKDVCLERLMVQGNRIQLKDGLESMINSLNASNISTLSLNQNALDAASLGPFFSSLHAPRLTTLHLSTCSITYDSSAHIASYLSSTRSRNLETLELNGNQLGPRGVRRIVDAVEHGNFTLKQLGLFSNDITPQIALEPEDDQGFADPPPISQQERRTADEIRQDESILSFQIHHRLPPLLERNRDLTRRARKAALKALAPARIILNSRPLNDEEMAKRVMKDVGERSSLQTFRLVDLPREVIYQIVRHTSQDATAFSAAQFARFRKYAEDRDGLGKMARGFRERIAKASWGEETRVMWQVREEWLRRGGWDKWDMEKPRDAVAADETAEGAWIRLSL